ncbi:VOC family protein [Natronolimnobius baerhuensis]|uniref:Fosmidomycin resistance protein n=1 Tax=Natronolimnobius baerhuensis TaxID=253108 RepID=A0A202EC80_9EURY|nr:VOC family protein [Natronolimnobius baerhuensis]OVE85866.1 fosmidomycin resistance protein [Natronolimnobius baerhuensis]
MLTGLAWLALETKSLEQARSFYADLLELSCRERGERELVFAAGETDLVVRRPDSVPRGGVHTHYAFSIPATEYDDWWDQLSTAGYDLEDAQFGELTSLYLYDPDGNCVELGQSDVAGPGIDGIFEVVLEVEDLERSQAFYAALGFETVDMGADRKRVRMSLNGSTALELWEPHLGIADARGGVHVDLGFETSEPTGALEAVSDHVQQVDHVADERVVVRDPDGHVITFTV